MNQDLLLSLAANARQWEELTHSISQAEQAAFDKVHDAFFVTHGEQFMARVYRSALGQALRNMTDAERDKLQEAFQRALTQAIAEQYTTHY